ncbi:MAG: triose-phosphate isomerase [Spirochaetaceae bacterium]|nr:triose-phosphate isomerase [Spirochaetaceae bacterium]
MRISYMAGNWKMNNTRSESLELVKELLENGSFKNKILIAPPFTALDAVSKVVAGTDLILGAQNMAIAESGAHTGETSVLMLKDIGVQSVILGHSERRAIYGETDKIINTKIHLALKHNLEVIFCVGETLEERENGIAEKIVKDQVLNGLKNINEAQLDFITIAYEPVWAIGTGKTASPDDADEIHSVIRKQVEELYSSDASEKVIIQYGGSVKPSNVKELMARPNIDGALVGGAALKAETFIPIMEYNK